MKTNDFYEKGQRVRENDDKLHIMRHQTTKTTNMQRQNKSY